MITIYHRFKSVFAAFLITLLIPCTALAQDGPDYDQWTLVAERAEGAIESARASNEALEELRKQVVLWRQTFLTAQETGAERLGTLRSQLKALGPAPMEGEPAESKEISARRAELTAQITRLQEPIVKAEEAYSRADGVIGEIDRIIRERQTSQLFELGPTPLNPLYWPRGIEELRTSFNGLAAGIREGWNNPTQQATLRDRLPAILGLLVVGAILIVRGRKWMMRLGYELRRRYHIEGFLWQFLISTGQVALPMIGIYALAEAAAFSNIGGPRATVLLDNLPLWAGVIIVGQWLAGQIFNEDENDAINKIAPEASRRARLLIAGLTTVLVARGVTAVIAARDFYPAEARAVIGLPLVLLGSLLLFRLAHTLTRHWTTGDSELASNRLLPFLGRGLMLAAVLAAILAAIGYESAANGLIYPAIRSLGPIGLVIVLQHLFTETFVLVTREDTNRDSLVTVLFGYLLILGSLPLLALIWGARLADLSEIWTRFQEGFTLGDSRISPTDFLSFVLVFIVGYTITRVLQGTLKNSVLPKTRIDTGGQNAIVSGVGYVGIFTAAIIAISSAGIDLSSLAIVAGALSVGIGFGLQNIVSNFVSGIILLIERPISQGDWIEVGGKHGYVRNISVRSTRVETFDRTDLIIPNSDLVSGQVTNWTRGNLRGRVIIPVGVAYGTDTRKVADILSEIAKAHPQVSHNPEPSVYFQGFGASSLDFEIRAVLKDVNWIMNVKSDINHEIASRFAAEGIEIPFNQSEITIRNLEDWLEKEKKT